MSVDKTKDQLWTRLFTGPVVFTFNKNWGLESLSVVCTGATSLQLLGTRQLGEDYPSQAIPIVEDEVWNWNKDDGFNDFTITVPAGATCKMTAF